MPIAESLCYNLRTKKTKKQKDSAMNTIISIACKLLCPKEKLMQHSEERKICKTYSVTFYYHLTNGVITRLDCLHLIGKTCQKTQKQCPYINEVKELPKEKEYNPIIVALDIISVPLAIYGAYCLYKLVFT